MPADILLYVLIAAGLIFWLKSILGTTDDDDQDRPDKSYLFRDQDGDGAKPKDGNNVVNLEALSGAAFILPRNVRIDNKTTENFLTDLSKSEPDFDLTHFSQNLENAFVIIIEAFAEGDLDTLEGLLMDDVYRAFAKTIKARDKKGESVETTVVSVEKVDITESDFKGDNLMVTVRFTAREICVIRNKAGEIISGDPERVTQMVDVWVFGRNMKSKTPEWYLHETRDDEIEDHKTPIPEAGE